MLADILATTSARPTSSLKSSAIWKNRTEATSTSSTIGQKDGAEVEANLKKLGKGIGDTTVSIFLRDMRHVWKKTDLKPAPLVTVALKKLSRPTQRSIESILSDWRQRWFGTRKTFSRSTRKLLAV
jgi:hypothetical protein